jgi:serine/threonine protein kinase
MHDDELDDVDGGDQDLEGDPFDDEDPDAPNLVPEAGPSPRVLPGGIELRELLGEGGMGLVYLGFHLSLGVDLAVKVLHPELGLRVDSQERLLREGLVLANIQHENIVKVHHCDRTTDGRLFIVMELLRGETLRQLRTRLGVLDALEVVKIGLQICRALEVAHGYGVIHRDITPLERDGAARARGAGQGD